ncbi:unnamed protein product [Rangifer tarandus platyrhynchus]|uniref:Uncharacterized protein n=2 Tax=Rangifer tarandus platyrhynchus TaxID=3082113 RepID=A0AC60A967_RANTA|nr:unnamed protein product [Rangifer tarandus platyrhynchus]
MCVLPVCGVLPGGGCLNLSASLPPSKVKQRHLRPRGGSGGLAPMSVQGPGSARMRGKPRHLGALTAAAGSVSPLLAAPERSGGRACALQAGSEPYQGSTQCLPTMQGPRARIPNSEPLKSL